MRKINKGGMLSIMSAILAYAEAITTHDVTWHDGRSNEWPRQGKYNCGCCVKNTHLFSFNIYPRKLWLDVYKSTLAWCRNKNVFSLSRCLESSFFLSPSSHLLRKIRWLCVGEPTIASLPSIHVGLSKLYTKTCQAHLRHACLGERSVSLSHGTFIGRPRTIT